MYCPKFLWHWYYSDAPFSSTILFSAHQALLFSISGCVSVSLCIERPFPLTVCSFCIWRPKLSGRVFGVLLFLTDTPKGFSLEGFLHRRARRNHLAPVIDAVAKWKLIVIPGAWSHCKGWFWTVSECFRGRWHRHQLQLAHCRIRLERGAGENSTGRPEELNSSIMMEWWRRRGGGSRRESEGWNRERLLLEQAYLGGGGEEGI